MTEQHPRIWPPSTVISAGRERGVVRRHPPSRPERHRGKVGIEIGFGREGRARTRTINITTAPSFSAPENAGAQPPVSSASMPKSNPANGLAAQPLRTIAHDADGSGKAEKITT